MAKEYRLSAERLEELKQELTYLKTVREKEVAELIKEARCFGDLSENSEYDEAKNEQGKLYSRIAELDEILSNYTIIEEQETHLDMVHVGNTVIVEDLEFDEKLQLPDRRLPGGRSHERPHLRGLSLWSCPAGPQGRGRGRRRGPRREHQV